MAGHLVAWALVGIGVSAATAAVDNNGTVWRIGIADRSFRDLAFNGSLRDYPADTPNTLEFTVGLNDPQTQFVAMHPGPRDPWAGRQVRTYRIRFDLPQVPEGLHVLEIDLVDTDSDYGPTLHVSVNGTAAEVPLAAGAGEISLVRPEKGKARNLRFVIHPEELRQGSNTITLRNRRGRWLLYDAVALKTWKGAPPTPTFAVEPSLFFIERDGRLLQEFALSAAALAEQAPIEVEVRSGDRLLARSTFREPTFGLMHKTIHVEPAEEPRPLTFILTAGGHRAESLITQAPERKWRIYIAPTVHTDIGYTHVQDEVIDIHNRNTDLAIELAEAFPLFQFNLECSWAAQMWLRDRPRYRHAALYDAARDRRVAVQGSYLNLLTGLCSDEELIRNLYYAARLEREHGVPLTTVMLTDAPSHVWSLPSILAGAGVKYLSIGANDTRAPVFAGNLHHKDPFWWEGPDGQRVLTWLAEGYGFRQVHRVGVREEPDQMRAAIQRELQWWRQRDDYPYDAVYFHGAYGDNLPLEQRLAENITRYSQRYAYPKVILADPGAFFEYVAGRWGDRIPSVRGCGGSWWEDGAGSSAVETAMNRQAHQDLVAAEIAWAAGLGADASTSYPEAEFDRAWQNVLLFDEHTSGASASVREPDSDPVRRQWAIKSGFAREASAESGRLLAQGLDRLADRINAPAGSLLAFNPSGRPRTDIVEARIPHGFRIHDGDSVIPSQAIHEDERDERTVAFVAKEVPAVGYRLYELRPGEAIGPAQLQFDGRVLENDFYRVQLDSQTGAIERVFDKTLGVELVDLASEYKLGQFIYAVGGGREDLPERLWPDPALVRCLSPVESRIEMAAAGPVFTAVRSVTKLTGFDRVEMETILYEHLRRIDLVFRLDKQLTYEKEAAYVAFPIAGTKPRFRYEVGGACVRPNEDQLPGACRDWFAVQRWVTVNTDEAGIAWSALDTPLITLCGLTPGRWQRELPITNGTIFAYIMNNYWYTNYKAGQDGPMTFRFSLTSDRAIEPPQASRFGESVHLPLRALRGHGDGVVPDEERVRSLCRVEPDHILLTALKQADDGRGLILRVRETSGRDTEAHITVLLPGISHARRCDLVERPREALAIEDGRITLPIRGFTLAAVRLE